MFEKQCNLFSTPEVDMEGNPRGGELEEEEEEGGSSEDSMDAVTLHIQVQDTVGVGKFWGVLKVSLRASGTQL